VALTALIFSPFSMTTAEARDVTDSSAVTAALEMTFRLFDSETKGAELWSETHPVVAVRGGLFQVLLRSVTPFPDGLFEGEIRWLQTEVGGEILAPRKPLTSVAYSRMAGEAEHAATAGTNNTGRYSVFVGSGAGFCTDTGSGNVCLGNYAGYVEQGSSKLIIANAADSSHVLIYGDFSSGRVGLGTMAPTTDLEVQGVQDGLALIKIDQRGTRQYTRAPAGQG
jgi:hypothetical protein